MRVIKRIITTFVCAFLSRFAQAQVHLPDTIYMYTENEKLYLDSIPFIKPDTLFAENRSGRFVEQALTLMGKIKPDTLFAENRSGRFEEEALTLMGKPDHSFYDVLSMCRNRSTPNSIRLIRIGNDLFRIGERIVIRIDKTTLKAFAKSFEYPRHCDHFSHTSHMSHYSSSF